MAVHQILLVDDEELALLGMEQGVHWKELGVDMLYKANSMKAAQEIIKSHTIDFMISDIEMPGGSGLDLIRWTRDNYPDILCIFYTCHADFEYCQEAIRIGAANYVLKPIPYEELEAIIRDGLSKAEKSKETKDLMNIWGEMTHKEETDSPIKKIKKIIAENLSVEISREELAKRVYMSPDYLSKLFKKETGMSLSDYIINKRILLAQQLLSTTELNVVEIAQKAGFSYSSYFVRIFKKKTGITPQQFREEKKK